MGAEARQNTRKARMGASIGCLALVSSSSPPHSIGEGQRGAGNSLLGANRAQTQAFRSLAGSGFTHTKPGSPSYIYRDIYKEAINVICKECGDIQIMDA